MRVKAGDAVLALVCVAVGHVLGGLLADWLDDDDASPRARARVRREEDGDDNDDDLLDRPSTDPLALQLESRAPAHIYRHYSGTATASAPALCTVCLEPLRPGMQVRITPCGHLFHARCLATWVYSNIERSGRRRPACPNCNAHLGVIGPRPSNSSASTPMRTRLRPRRSQTVGPVNDAVAAAAATDAAVSYTITTTTDPPAGARARARVSSAAINAEPENPFEIDQPIPEHLDIPEPATTRTHYVTVSRAVLDEAREHDITPDLVAEDAYVRMLARRRSAILRNATVAPTATAESQ